MCSSGSFTNIEVVENPATGHAWTPLEVLLHRLERDRMAPAETGACIRDQAGLAQWPRTQRVQPIAGGPRFTSGH